jgi:prevent-host-death family protein
MITIGAYDAKTHFSELLDKVADGEQVIITKHRVSVARLVPAGSSSHQPLAETIVALRKFRRNQKATVAEIAAMIREGRR